MTQLQERDAMICRACGNEERASEGYPCAGCGTFICVICNMKGIVRCRSCGEPAQVSAQVSAPLAPGPDAPGLDAPSPNAR